MARKKFCAPRQRDFRPQEQDCARRNGAQKVLCAAAARFSTTRTRLRASKWRAKSFVRRGSAIFDHKNKIARVETARKKFSAPRQRDFRPQEQDCARRDGAQKVF